MANYQKDAQRTCASLGSEKLDLAHMVLGIVSEQEEFLKAVVLEDEVNQREELADMCWYVTNYCTFRGYNFQNIVENCMNVQQEEWEQEVSAMDVFVSKLADYVKKYIAYNKPIDRESEENVLRGIIFSIILENCGFSFDKDLERNINKLKLRFPDKFTEYDALNRDLDGERKILEG
jgi:NTP pyrophosphatase (non-canonical NTP hydrolase)